MEWMRIDVEEKRGKNFCKRWRDKRMRENNNNRERVKSTHQGITRLAYSILISIVRNENKLRNCFIRITSDIWCWYGNNVLVHLLCSSVRFGFLIPCSLCKWCALYVIWMVRVRCEKGAFTALKYMCEILHMLGYARLMWNARGSCPPHDFHS